MLSAASPHPLLPLHRLPAWMPWTPRWTPLLLASLEPRSPASWLSCCAQTLYVCLERLACPEIFHHRLLTSSAAPLGVLLSRSPLFAWPLGSPLLYSPFSKSFGSPQSPLILVLTSVCYSGKAFPALFPTAHSTSRACWRWTPALLLSLGLWGSRSWIFPSFLGLLWTPSGGRDSGHRDPLTCSFSVSVSHLLSSPFAQKVFSLSSGVVRFYFTEQIPFYLL